MTSVRQVQNVANLISSIQVLDGTESVFPTWRSRLDDVLGFQNTLDIVKGTLTRPKEPSKTETVSARSVEYTKGYNPGELTADWDALSDLACYTIRLTLSNPLAQRYRKVKPASRLYSTIVNAYEKNTRARQMRLQEAFWNARHNPNEVIALWIGQVRVAADDLLSIEELPTDRQIADRLVGGLDPSWSNVRDSIVYTATEMSLDDVIGALEAHEVSLNGTKTNDMVSAAAATAKRFGCSHCGKRGHRSSDCYQLKNKGKAKAGAVTTVKLGGYESGSFDDDDEIGVIYE
ncbi:uncharacterized protein PGTG_05139 [Puccinia graminis f. sp. tritici CRL 75-36-700-3]|uniref:CCHC-type domain-containing protein n=1 Tax=Puccinia graminis f. sp. tritici (strain CRL 75-36-700-3 / race SCCL) TaxID=418459 RepID=E3K6R4_PUCGT|nr:uncharacterized protein PGTG_05139 [Puccinia graminis f. sp. tritici CRL 75-36-700-3]EFP79914.1 hypothetical protein PGTG_05139 [Puccinia graminis f. sp. tritici CRL 75-36-700-3]